MDPKVATALSLRASADPIEHRSEAVALPSRGRAELRRRALLAAATVTLAMACHTGDTAPYKADDADAPADTDPTVASPTDTEASPQATETTEDPVDPPDPVDPADPADPIDSADTDGGRPSRPDCAGLDLAACCQQLQTFCARHAAEGSERYNTCVYGPNFDGSTGCIPWGPPVPPRFRGVA